MIPPSLLNASFLFTLIPIWEQEPAPLPPPCPAPPDSTDNGADGTAPAAQSAGDADGVNDQVALRMVFKGYRLGITTDWNAEVNQGYERFVESRSDDDAERQRQNQRAGSPVRPNPPPAGNDIQDPAVPVDPE
jgi:hypothetical protein